MATATATLATLVEEGAGGSVAVLAPGETPLTVHGASGRAAVLFLDPISGAVYLTRIGARCSVRKAGAHAATAEVSPGQRVELGDGDVIELLHHKAGPADTQARSFRLSITPPAAPAVLQSELSSRVAAARAQRSEATQTALGDNKLALVVCLESVAACPECVPNEAAPSGHECALALRPGLVEFLREASKQFELHLYAGKRALAQKACEAVDKDGALFGKRLAASDDVLAVSAGDLPKHRAGCESLLRFREALPLLGEESIVAIVDSRPDFWDSFQNVVQIEPFDRQKGGVDCRLSQTGERLKAVHKEFFRLYGLGRAADVRQIINSLLSRTLAGITLAFSGLIPPTPHQQEDPLWKFATRLGATCVTMLDPQTTHLVTKTLSTEKAHAAIEIGSAHIVTVEWLHEAFWTWSHPPEDKFIVPGLTLRHKRQRDEKEGECCPRPPQPCEASHKQAGQEGELVEVVDELEKELLDDGCEQAQSKPQHGPTEVAQ